MKPESNLVAAIGMVATTGVSAFTFVTTNNAIISSLFLFIGAAFAFLYMLENTTTDTKMISPAYFPVIWEVIACTLFIFLPGWMSIFHAFAIFFDISFIILGIVYYFNDEIDDFLNE